VAFRVHHDDVAAEVDGERMLAERDVATVG
jgi:hypothetical protein